MLGTDRPGRPSPSARPFDFAQGRLRSRPTKTLHSLLRHASSDGWRRASEQLSA